MDSPCCSNGVFEKTHQYSQCCCSSVPDFKKPKYPLARFDLDGGACYKTKERKKKSCGRGKSIRTKNSSNFMLYMPETTDPRSSNCAPMNQSPPMAFQMQCTCDTNEAKMSNEPKMNAEKVEDTCEEFMNIVQDAVLDTVNKSVKGTIEEYFGNITRKIDAVCSVIKQMKDQIWKMNAKNDVRFKCLCEFLFEHLEKANGKNENDIKNSQQERKKTKIALKTLNGNEKEHIFNGQNMSRKQIEKCVDFKEANDTMRKSKDVDSLKQDSFEGLCCCQHLNRRKNSDKPDCSNIPYENDIDSESGEEGNICYCSEFSKESRRNNNCIEDLYEEMNSETDFSQIAKSDNDDRKISKKPKKMPKNVRKKETKLSEMCCKCEKRKSRAQGGLHECSCNVSQILNAMEVFKTLEKHCCLAEQSQLDGSDKRNGLQSNLTCQQFRMSDPSSSRMPEMTLERAKCSYNPLLDLTCCSPDKSKNLVNENKDINSNTCQYITVDMEKYQLQDKSNHAV